MVELHITMYFPVSQLSSLNCAKPLRGWRSIPSALSSRFPYHADAATQGKTLLVAV